MTGSPIASPERVWWEPFSKPERLWVSVSVVFLLLVFLSMPVWVISGKQNQPNTFYRVSPDRYLKLTDAFISRYKVGQEGLLPIVKPPVDGDAYLMAEQWVWTPILELQRGKTYRLHVSSIDVEHSVSIQPININFEVAPGYDEILNITPTKDGVYTIICNEYCGIGHATMTGQIIVNG
jgi:cytochrome c oxidase subunit 2